MTKNSFRFQAPRFNFRLRRLVVTAVELKQLETRFIRLLCIPNRRLRLKTRLDSS
jgi:hypothetical protein